jgi:hypothetical protein
MPTLCFHTDADVADWRKYDEICDGASGFSPAFLRFLVRKARSSNEWGKSGIFVWFSEPTECPIDIPLRLTCPYPDEAFRGFSGSDPRLGRFAAELEESSSLWLGDDFFTAKVLPGRAGSRWAHLAQLGREAWFALRHSITRSRPRQKSQGSLSRVYQNYHRPLHRFPARLIFGPDKVSPDASSAPSDRR